MVVDGGDFCEVGTVLGDGLPRGESSRGFDVLFVDRIVRRLLVHDADRVVLLIQAVDSKQTVGFETGAVRVPRIGFGGKSCVVRADTRVGAEVACELGTGPADQTVGYGCGSRVVLFEISGEPVPSLGSGDGDGSSWLDVFEEIVFSILLESGGEVEGIDA